MKEFIEITEKIFNRPLDILLIVGGLLFMLAAVLLRLAGVENRIADTIIIAFGTLMITAGSSLHIHLPKLLKALPVKETLAFVSDIFVLPESDTESYTEPLRMKIPKENLPEPASDQPMLTASSETQTAEAAKFSRALTEGAVSEKNIESPSGICLYYIEITQFEFIWNDRKRGSDQCVSFYKPLPPAGYKIFGHYAQGDDSPPRHPVFAVKETAAIDAQGILAYPLRYERIWYDPRVGAIWRPVAPLGFRCMGDAAGRSYLEPDRKEIVCVKAELVTEGKNGELIWDNRGSGRLSEIAISPILPSDPEKGMTLHLFQGYGDWSRRRGYASLPVIKKAYTAPDKKIQAAR